MAFNVQTFLTRSGTAVIFVMIMLAGILCTPGSFLLLFSVIHFGCWWEYLKLVEKISGIKQATFGRIGAAIAGYGIMLLVSCGAISIVETHLQRILSFSLIAIGLLIWLASLFSHANNKKFLLLSLLGFVYISVPLGLLITMYPGGVLTDTIPIGPVYLPLFIIITIWINDTMAYIVGSLLGKTPLSKISPKKTWEGTLGGILLCTLVTGVLIPYLMYKGIYWQFIAAALAIAISGTIGDLWESKLKRMAGVKDSGSIMPGHGGFLDRFDSLLFAVPFAFLVFYAANVISLF